MYRESLNEIMMGVYHLSVCLWGTTKRCVIDYAKCAYKHPIAAFLLVYCMTFMFYTMTMARIERDKLVKQTYRQEVTIDSLTILAK